MIVSIRNGQKMLKNKPTTLVTFVRNVAGKLCSHHLEDWHSNEDLRYDVSNGVCLCESCHREFHYDYMKHSKHKCTEDDYLDFKEVKEKYDIR